MFARKKQTNNKYQSLQIIKNELNNKKEKQTNVWSNVTLRAACGSSMSQV